MALRLYCINNMYLSSLQQGLQGLHAGIELGLKVNDNKTLAESAYNDFQEWARNHKTVIMLNGGFSSNLQEIYDVLSQNPSIPIAKFNEEQAALNSALTSIALVIDKDYIFSVEGIIKYSSEEIEMIMRIDQMDLAR